MGIVRGGLSAFVAAAALAAATAAQALTNTATDASYGDFLACNGRVGFRTSEQLQAQTDLNGDLDAFDNVFQVLSLALFTVTNGGVDASGPFACGDHVFAFGASELNEGADLNGDLDAFDNVLHVYNASLNIMTPLSYAVSNVKASGSIVAFAVPEAQQTSLGVDLNGDLDTADQILHVVDTTTFVVTNVGQDASSTIIVEGNRVAFLTSETNQFNTTLNSDGDPLDFVLQVYDAGTATLTNIGRQAQSNIEFDGDVIAFQVNEAQEGSTSLNPDPDASDNVLHTYCMPGAACAFPGLHNVALQAEYFDLEGDLIGVGTREKRQNFSDLNGDGDKGDTVAFAHRLSTGATINTTKAAYRGIVKVAGNYVVFRIPEKNQFKIDLNADSDIRDLVVNVFDTVALTTTNTGRAVHRTCNNPPTPASEGCFAARGDNVFMFTREKDQNKTDLNLDGDIRDRVIELWRLSTSTFASSGKAIYVRGGIALGDSIALFRRSERAEKLDLNGDGDKRDYVSAVYDSGTLLVTNLDSAESYYLVENDNAVIRTREGVEGVNLNADTDFDDGILQYQAF